MTESQTEPEFISVKEAARRLGIGRNTAYLRAADGSLPAYRIGRRLLIPRAAIDRMAAGTVPPGKTAS